MTLRSLLENRPKKEEFQLRWSYVRGAVGNKEAVGRDRTQNGNLPGHLVGLPQGTI